MTEIPKPKPERSADVTIAIHSVLWQISDSVPEGEFDFHGIAETDIAHGSLFPASTCQGKISVTYLDNLVGYADLECENKCKAQREFYLSTDPSVRNFLETTLMIKFEDVGFISREYVLDEETNAQKFASPIVIRQQTPKGTIDGQRFKEIEKDIKESLGKGFWIPTDLED